MVIVQIEHAVPNFDRWKAAYDSDPVNREQSGVRRYRVLRPLDNPNFAMIDLEFNSLSEAEAFLAAMRKVWGRVEGTVIESPRVRVVEVVESKQFVER
jgi:heme-degrading monooxygenase HmoA